VTITETEDDAMKIEEDKMAEHDTSQEEIDAMTEEEKMEMERKIVEELAAQPEVVVEEEMPVMVAKPVPTTPEPVPEPVSQEPTLISSGNFQGADSFHKGSGQAKIIGLADGSSVVRLENFSVTNGPDLRVYLVNSASPNKDQVKQGLELAPLKGNVGNQNYTVPAGVDPSGYNSVVIYCKPFSVIFSTANLN